MHAPKHIQFGVDSFKEGEEEEEEDASTNPEANQKTVRRPWLYFLKCSSVAKSDSCTWPLVFDLVSPDLSASPIALVLQHISSVVCGVSKRMNLFAGLLGCDANDILAEHPDAWRQIRSLCHHLGSHIFAT